MAKSKQKTHKASAKVLTKKKNGTITYKMSNGNHKTGKDSSKQVRQRKGTAVISNANAGRLKSVI